MTLGAPRETARRPSSLRLYGLIGLMVVFWAGNFLIGKIALREFPSALLACLRVSLAAVLILPVYAWSRRRQPRSQAWSRGEIPSLLLLGLVGTGLNQLTFVMGLKRTSVAHASLLMGLTPVLVLLIAAAIRQEVFTWKKALGLAIALSGVAVLNAAPSKASGVTLLGDAFIVLAALTFALFTVFGKRVTVRHGSVTVNTFVYLGGSLFLLPLTLWQASQFYFGSLSAAAWLSLLYMALFPSLVSYLIYYYALCYIPASRISAFSYLQPLLATGMAAVFLGEVVNSGLVAGGALVLAGVFVTERA